MKTTIEWKHSEPKVHEGVAPMIQPDENSFSLVDEDCGVVVEDIPLHQVKRLIFEPEQ